jgi:hypothetical protein
LLKAPLLPPLEAYLVFAVVDPSVGLEAALSSWNDRKENKTIEYPRSGKISDCLKHKTDLTLNPTRWAILDTATATLQHKSAL